MTPSDVNQPNRQSRLSKVRRQDEAIVALLQNSTLEKAAQSAKLHPTTLRRWWKDPDFRSKYEEAARGYHMHAIGRMQSCSQAALATVMRIMSNQAASDSVRLQAAKYLLDSGKRWDRGATMPLPDVQERQGVSIADRLNAARERMARHREDETRECPPAPVSITAADDLPQIGHKS